MTQAFSWNSPSYRTYLKKSVPAHLRPKTRILLSDETKWQEMEHEPLNSLVTGLQPEVIHRPDSVHWYIFRYSALQPSADHPGAVQLASSAAYLNPAARLISYPMLMTAAALNNLGLILLSDAWYAITACPSETNATSPSSSSVLAFPIHPGDEAVFCINLAGDAPEFAFPPAMPLVIQDAVEKTKSVVAQAIRDLISVRPILITAADEAASMRQLAARCPRYAASLERLSTMQAAKRQRLSSSSSASSSSSSSSSPSSSLDAPFPEGGSESQPPAPQDVLKAILQFHNLPDRANLQEELLRHRQTRTGGVSQEEGEEGDEDGEEEEEGEGSQEDIKEEKEGIDMERGSRDQNSDPSQNRNKDPSLYQNMNLGLHQNMNPSPLHSSDPNQSRNRDQSRMVSQSLNPSRNPLNQNTGRGPSMMQNPGLQNTKWPVQGMGSTNTNTPPSVSGPSPSVNRPGPSTSGLRPSTSRPSPSTSGPSPSTSGPSLNTRTTTNTNTNTSRTSLQSQLSEKERRLQEMMGCCSYIKLWCSPQAQPGQQRQTQGQGTE
jgi:hypothetical protein